MINKYEISVEKMKRREFGGLRNRWELKTDLKETGHEGVEWIKVAQVSIQIRDDVNTAMNYERRLKVKLSLCFN
jgi:hypothetical protein